VYDGQNACGCVALVIDFFSHTITAFMGRADGIIPASGVRQLDVQLITYERADEADCHEPHHASENGKGNST